MVEYSCLNEQVLEDYLLGVNFSEKDWQFIGDHLKNCSKCRKLYRELILFYEILENEIQKPIGNKILDLAYRLYPNHKSGSIGIGLKVASELDAIFPKYKITLAYNLTANNGIKKFSDLNILNYPKDAVIFRTITDHINGDTFLYLYSRNGIRLSNCQVLFMDQQICKTNVLGAGRMLMSLEDLKEKTVTLHEEQIGEFDLSMTEKYALVN